MAKEVEVNNGASQDRGRQSLQQPGDTRNRQELQGKAREINENRVQDQEPARTPAPPRRGSGNNRNAQKLQGKALQINETSVEDTDPLRTSAPLPR